MRLVYRATGQEVQIGDKVTLSDGAEVTVESIKKPHKPSSTGRVYLMYNPEYISGYFPEVIKAHWIEREDH